MRAILILVVPVALAACGKPDVSATNASVEEVQNKVVASGAMVQMKPGRWEGSISISSSAAPGAAKTENMVACVRAEDITPESNPFAAQLQAGCKYDNFKMDGGKLNSTMTCEQRGMIIKTVASGEFTPEAYKAKSVTEMSGQGAGPMAGMKTETAIDLKRTSDCVGNEPRP